MLTQMGLEAYVVVALTPGALAVGATATVTCPLDPLEERELYTAVTV